MSEDVHRRRERRQASRSRRGRYQAPDEEAAPLPEEVAPPSAPYAHRPRPVGSPVALGPLPLPPPSVSLPPRHDVTAQPLLQRSNSLIRPDVTRQSVRGARSSSRRRAAQAEGQLPPQPARANGSVVTAARPVTRRTAREAANRKIRSLSEGVTSKMYEEFAKSASQAKTVINLARPDQFGYTPLLTKNQRHELKRRARSERNIRAISLLPTPHSPNDEVSNPAEAANHKYKHWHKPWRDDDDRTGGGSGAGMAC